MVSSFHVIMTKTPYLLSIWIPLPLQVCEAAWHICSRRRCQLIGLFLEAGDGDAQVNAIDGSCVSSPFRRGKACKRWAGRLDSPSVGNVAKASGTYQQSRLPVYVVAKKWRREEF